MSMRFTRGGIYIGRGDTRRSTLSYSGDHTRIPGSAIASDWTDDQWSIGWLIDSQALGTTGITPQLTEDLARLWRRHTVDDRGRLRPRDYQRVIILALAAEGEYFEIDGEGGAVVPMPTPSRIIRRRGSDEPASYRWQLTDGRGVVEEAAERVRHIYIPTHGRQLRGAPLYRLAEDIATERRAFLPAVINLARLSSILRIFHRTDASAPLWDAEASEPETVEVDWTRSGVTEIARDDDIIAPTVSAGPVPVMDVERVANGAIGRVYGISGMQAGRDYSQSNFSSAKMAWNQDRASFYRFAAALEPALDRVYGRWLERAEAIGAPYDPRWVYPVLPSVDPHRDAQRDRQQIADGVISRQMVMRQYGYDPETVMREIDEWRARYPEGL